MNKWFAAPFLLLILFLSACNLSQDNPLPDGKPGALYTEAAMTVSVKLTADGIGKPQSAQASSPEETVSPAEAATPAMLTLAPGGGDESKSGPCDQVKFVKDVTIPDDINLAPGEKFTKIWRLQNTGSCPWTIGYLLYFESGDSMDAPDSLELTSETIQPGDTVDVSVDMIAPQEPGMYQGNWKIRNVKGDGFGVGTYSKAFWVKINVVEGAEMMFDFNIHANEAVWGSGSIPVDTIDLGVDSLTFDHQGAPGDPYVSLENEQNLEGGKISGILLSAYPPVGKGNYIIGRFPDYIVKAGDFLFGRVGLITNPDGNCGNGDVNFRINLITGGDPSTVTTLGEWHEICDDLMKSLEIDLDNYKGDTVQIFLSVIANTNSEKNFAVWDSLSIHR